MDALRHTARFLGVDEASAELAAAAGAVRPEQDSFNRDAASLGSKRPKQGMLVQTRKALQTFFETHWKARFPEVSVRVETAFTFYLCIHRRVLFFVAPGNKPARVLKGYLMMILRT